MKRIILLLCVLLLAGILESCTSVSDNTQQNETEASSEGTEDPLEDTSSER